MLAPFATLAFLIVFWLTAVVVAQILNHSKSRIAMALRGVAPAKVGLSLGLRSRAELAAALHG